MQIAPKPATASPVKKVDFMREDQEWVKDKKEYREEFPTLGGKSREQRARDTMQNKTMSDFPLFDIKPSDGKKGPIKFSDNMGAIIRKKN